MGNPDDGHPLAESIVTAARACIGTRFRPQGRTAHGLDCLGVILACADAVGISLQAPADYRMQGHCEELVKYRLTLQGFVQIHAVRARPGDLLLSYRTSQQAHFAIVTDRGIVEADCGLRRVVERPFQIEIPGTSLWRFPRGDA
jgi:lipoprotein Spr